jgi:hypothetical protein
MEVEALPDELLFHIFSLLTPTCLRSASLVSHQWHQVRCAPPKTSGTRTGYGADVKRDGTKVAKDNCVWKSMCEKAKLTMNSANRRKFENDWRAWYQAMVSAITSSAYSRTGSDVHCVDGVVRVQQEGSFDILETDAYSSGIEV